MDVAGASDVRISKKHMRETTETAEIPDISSTLGTLATWGGARLNEVAEDAFTICSSCQSLLFQPACNPESQKGIFRTKKKFILHRSLSAVSSSALGGCIVCRLAIAAKPTPRQDTASSLDGFYLALFWIDVIREFIRIDVTPVNHLNEKLSRSGYLNAIRLVSEGKYKNEAINYSIPLHTNSELCRSIAMKWFTKCITEHTKCREQHTKTARLPTRLIDVGLPTGTQQPRLVLTSELGSASNSSYVTLSHRWASTHVVKLKCSNIDSFKQCLPLNHLSATFLDAITVTRALGVRYLWIDSLCILQDSPNDWQAESLEMGNIYRNCICNIAATGSAETGGGIFQERDPYWVTPSKVHIQYEGHDKVYLASHKDPWGKWVGRSALNKRGWVLQERLLSPRTLHFASQLFWECRMHQACETYPAGMPIENLRYFEEYGHGHPISLKNWPEDFEGKDFWMKIVQNYGRCSVTKPEDRLIAIAGVAKSIQPLLNDEYLAGLWEKDLPYNLVWVMRDIDGSLCLSETYRCPSWSWAALDYSSALIRDLLISDDCRVRSLLNIQEVHMELVGSDSFGPLRGGYLRLTGRIGQIFSLANIAEDGIWLDDHYSYEAELDLESGRNKFMNVQCLYCLPILVRKLNPGPEDLPTITYCLLLKQLKPDVIEYMRVGILRVSLDPNAGLPEEIRWIAEYAKSEIDSSDLVTITIV